MPSVTELKKGIVELVSGAQSSTLKDKIIEAYTERVASKLSAILNGNESLVVDDLKKFLEENWPFVKGTALVYTALPEHPVTKLFCDVARFVEEETKQLNQEVSISALALLMPGISQVSIIDDIDEQGKRLYPDFDGTEDLDYILKTHILNDTNDALIPLMLLTQLDVSAESDRVCNPYFDYEHHAGETAYLNSEEKERLNQHSSETRDVIHAKKAYELLLNDSSNFLGYLRQFIRHLALNSVDGLGEETNAGAGVYDKIINFHEYYEKLAETEKQKIPPGLRTELDELFRLSSDPSANINATQNIATCLATRRSMIVKTMQGYESVLSNLGLMSKVAKTDLLSQAKELFVEAKQSLKDKLNDRTYNKGHEALPFSSKLLSLLQSKKKIAQEKQFSKKSYPNQNYFISF